MFKSSYNKTMLVLTRKVIKGLNESIGAARKRGDVDSVKTLIEARDGIRILDKRNPRRRKTKYRNNFKKHSKRRRSVRRKSRGRKGR